MSLVQFRVSEQLLGWVFRLPCEMRFTGAQMEESPGGSALLLTVDIPAAPEDAATVDLTYTRRNDLPDPLTLTGMRFLRADGTEIRQEPERPE